MFPGNGLTKGARVEDFNVLASVFENAVVNSKAGATGMLDVPPGAYGREDYPIKMDLDDRQDAAKSKLGSVAMGDRVCLWHVHVPYPRRCLRICLFGNQSSSFRAGQGGSGRFGLSLF